MTHPGAPQQFPPHDPRFPPQGQQQYGQPSQPGRRPHPGQHPHPGSPFPQQHPQQGADDALLIEQKKIKWSAEVFVRYGATAPATAAIGKVEPKED